MKVKRETMPNNCLICNTETDEIFDEHFKVHYDICPHCDFVYKQKQHHLPFDEEGKQYERHNNSFESLGYVDMFKRLIKNHIQPLDVKGIALEFGSGPGPVLKELLKQEKDLDVYDFDPYFNNNVVYLEHLYNLITATEVVEHFHDPLKEFEHLASLLIKGGYLVIMTKFRNMPDEEFLNWWYRRDITHVSFYNNTTFKYLANKFGLKIEFSNNENIVIFTK